MVLELVVGGFLFWLLIIALIIACEISTVREEHWSFLWLLVFCTVLAWASNFNPFKWVWFNPGTTLIFVGIYALTGIGWGFVKWMFHLHNERDVIEANIDKYKKQYNDAKAKVASPFQGTFTDFLESDSFYPPLISRAKHNKTLISVWMIWWPFSLLWTLFHDVIRRACNWVIEFSMQVFDKINNVVFGSLNNSE